MDLGGKGDESDYREHELRTGHIHEAEEEQDYQEGEEEQDYDADDDLADGEVPLEKMKEVIVALQVALKERDIQLLGAKKQNIELLTELEQLSEQYIREQSSEADQLSKVKQYEEEFLQIQQGMIFSRSNDHQTCSDR